MDEFNRIIYIWNTPLGYRDYHRLGVKYLENKGYNVEVWRLISNNSVQMVFSAGMYKGKNYCEFYEAEFTDRLKKCDKKTIFIMFQLNHYIIPLTKAGHRYVLMCGLNPIFWPKGELFRELSKTNDVVEKTLPKRILKGLPCVLGSYRNRIRDLRINRIIDAQVKRMPPCVVISSTKNAVREYVPKYLIKEARITHSMDYDRYIETNRESINTENRHIVYCDSGFFHKGLDATMSSRDMGHRFEQVYYEQLNTLFQRLEDYYGLPIVITGHPHVDYDDNAFCGREIYFDKTCELTRNAVLFITTNSTAISFALLYNKPILKIANQNLRFVDCFGLDAYELVKYEAEVLLECGFLDLDNENDLECPWEHVKTPSVPKRNEYINKYIIDNNTTDQTIIEILEEQIHELNK